jgi:hypothetical protein
MAICTRKNGCTQHKKKEKGETHHGLQFIQ